MVDKEWVIALRTRRQIVNSKKHTPKTISAFAKKLKVPEQLVLNELDKMLIKQENK